MFAPVLSGALFMTGSDSDSRMVSPDPAAVRLGSERLEGTREPELGFGDGTGLLVCDARCRKRAE